MDTEQEIRQREEQSTENSSSGSSDTPTLADEDAGGSSGGGLPTPSISKKHVAILGVVVAVGVALWWLRSRDGTNSGSGSLDSARKEMDGSTESTIPDEDEEGQGELHVEHDPENPLAADASVVKQFRDRGLLTTPEEEA